MAQHRILGRTLIGAAVLAVVAASCTSSDPASSSVAEGTSPPPLTVQDEAGLAAEALARFCVQPCDTKTVYIQDTVFTSNTLAGNEKPMPPETIAAIQAAFPDAAFVTMEEANALFGDDALVDGGNGILLSVGPVRYLRDDVIGIEVGRVTARDGGYGQIEQFGWNGEDWEPTDSSTTGITTTSWIA